MAKKLDKTVAFTTLWVARGCLTVLAYAGMMYLLGGIDREIAIPVSVIGVALLLKETL